MLAASPLLPQMGQLRHRESVNILSRAHMRAKAQRKTGLKVWTQVMILWLIEVHVVMSSVWKLTWKFQIVRIFLLFLFFHPGIPGGYCHGVSYGGLQLIKQIERSQRAQFNLFFECVWTWHFQLLSLIFTVWPYKQLCWHECGVVGGLKLGLWKEISCFRSPRPVLLQAWAPFPMPGWCLSRVLPTSYISLLTPVEIYCSFLLQSAA